eukprot:TRINITY_DN538_c0_g1_i1.p1 TRINITY_DN538_c0_g1~~TRINITY_DN538_c0_g1_i1.p1  ORF type:complete len:873 (-),score=191.45 TRINITY_DN538_c0_g1_i1:86-2704(-)
MAGLGVALMQPNDAQACRQFCTEILQTFRHWGPAEQRMLFEQLPLAFQRLYFWFALSNPGLEESLLRTLHPEGPLMLHLATWQSPAFVFPLQQLPPRALRSALLSLGMGSKSYGYGFAGAGGEIGVGNGRSGLRGRTAGDEDLGSCWFGLLGRERVALAPSGDVEGVALTALEYSLTCLINFLVSGQPLYLDPRARGAGSSAGVLPGSQGAGAMRGPAGAYGSGPPGGAGVGGAWPPPGSSTGGFGAGAGAGAPWGAPGSSAGFSGQRGAQRPGAVSVAFERLLLAHLKAHLQHGEYELAYAHEPVVSRFLLHLIHEFLIAPGPPEEALPLSLRGSTLGSARLHDIREQPGPLHAARIVAIHVLANPALRRGCEEVRASSAVGGRGYPERSAARLTREVALLGPSLLRLVEELLARATLRRQSGLGMVTSLTRLWLVLLQPWKAERLLAWYSSVRSPSPQLDGPVKAVAASVSATVGRMLHLDRSLDVALLGLEPEVALGAPEPPVPRATPWDQQAGDSRMVSAAAIRLVAGAGDAQSWASYVESFQGAYHLAETVLTTPLHEQLCLQLCRHLAGPEAAAAAASAALAATGEASGDAQPADATAAAALRQRHLLESGPRAPELLRQRPVIAALKALAQALLCFTDPQLLETLAALPQYSGQQQQLSEGFGGLGGSALRVPVFAEGTALRPEFVLAVSMVWAALLAASAAAPTSASHELQPLLFAISSQLQHAPAWARERLPAMEDADQHRVFAQGVLMEQARRAGARGFHLGAGGASAAAFSAGAAGDEHWSLSAEEVQFVGSEWQRPLRGGEWESLLLVAYWLASMIDWLLGREARATACGPVPQTEWPRMFANVNFIGCVLIALLLALLW